MFALLMPFPKRWLAVLGMGCVLAGILAGCQDSSGVGKLVPVEGRVTVAGKPLTTGTVIFHPDAAKGNVSKHEPRGEIDPQGNYKLMAVPGKEGAPPGWYKVAVVAYILLNPKDPYSPTKYLTDQKYADVDSSRLALEVVENPAPGAYDLKLPK